MASYSSIIGIAMGFSNDADARSMSFTKTKEENIVRILLGNSGSTQFNHSDRRVKKESN